MRYIRYYYRRFRSLLLKHDRPQNRTAVLYILNILLALSLVFQLGASNESQTGSTLSFLDRYQDDISVAMEAFDFMHKQRLAAKAIPPPQDHEELPIEEKQCHAWWSRSWRPMNASVIWNNALWQTVRPASTEIYLYSAFYDHRPNGIFPKASGTLQVIGVVWRRLRQDIYCQLWNTDSTFVVVKALAREIWQRAWDPRDRFYVPVLFTCPLPSDMDQQPVPSHVSLVTSDLCAQKRGPSTFLPVQSHQKTIDRRSEERLKKRHTAVCVKGMDFLEDLSARFVEWLELNFHVGADKVVIYTYAVHPRVRRVIEHYASTTGRLEHIPLALAGHAPNAPLHRSRFIKRNRQQKRRHEIVPYNDCLYRHIGTHEYVLIVDVDELVVPIQHENWKETLNEVKRRAKGEDKEADEDATWTAFSIANAFFFDNSTSAKRQQEQDGAIPTYVHILKHDQRSRKISPPGIYGKSFMDTRNVATVFNHFPLHKQQRGPKTVLRPTFYVDPNMARKNHYKTVCPIESRDECPDLYGRTVTDDSATRYAALVAPKIRDTLRSLGIEPKS